LDSLLYEEIPLPGFHQAFTDAPIIQRLEDKGKRIHEPVDETAEELSPAVDRIGSSAYTISEGLNGVALRRGRMYEGERGKDEPRYGRVPHGPFGPPYACATV